MNAAVRCQLAANLFLNFISAVENWKFKDDGTVLRLCFNSRRTTAFPNLRTPKESRRRPPDYSWYLWNGCLFFVLLFELHSPGVKGFANICISASRVPPSNSSLAIVNCVKSSNFQSTIEMIWKVSFSRSFCFWAYSAAVHVYGVERLFKKNVY